MEKKLADKIAVANIDIVAADREVMWSIPKGCVWFTMQCRTGVDIRIGASPNKAASPTKPYFTMKSGTSWNEIDLNIVPKEGHPIFFAAASAVVVEILIGICTEEV